MNTQLQTELDHKFGRKSKTKIKKVDSKMVIKYTRVSGKKQFDTNESIENQNKAINEFASRYNLEIVASFGDTYESAKTDERKEFQRMIDFCKRSRGKISTILVYKMTRFSRTGGKAISIADELRTKYGIHIIAVTEPIDTSNSNGVLFQEMQLIFAKWDNVQRQQVTHAGLKSKYEQGEWCIAAPIGYDKIKINGQTKIVLNDYGKKLKKAWEWKLQGYSNEQIIEMLAKIGIKTYKQRIFKIFKNPFYCGLISHGILDGKVVQGKHEPMVSQEDFFKINEIRLASTKYGVSHKRQNVGVPLKVFISCGECGDPFTGYIVKKKNLYYYKCRRVGCKCNKSAKEMHKLFLELLGQYQIKEAFIEPIVYQMEHDYHEGTKDAAERELLLNKKAEELKTGMLNLEENYHVKREMTREVFDRLMAKLVGEREETVRILGTLTVQISNLCDKLWDAAGLCLKITKLWVKGSVNLKEKLQKLIFPEGIIYDKKNGAFRTPKVNSVIAEIARLSGDLLLKTKGLNPFLSGQSLFAEKEGFEPPDL
jgi:site-specific DNA recombinase